LERRKAAMAEPKWTQGEWRVFMGYLTSPEGQEYPTADVICDGRVIATVYWPLDDPEEFFANARVLAAAKTLYEACEAALNFHDRYCDRVGPSETWARWVHEKLRNALRKARGEE